MTKQMQPPLLQPIGFWTMRAGEAIRARTRSRLAEISVSQPEWWLLHQLSLHPAGIDVDEIVATIGPNDSDDAITDAISSASKKGWITVDETRVKVTDTGQSVFDEAARIQTVLNYERRQGISDADYETTIRTLQRTIENVGGDAWHW